MWQRLLLVLGLIVSGVSPLIVQAADGKAAPVEFPGRALYPAVPYIELDDFYKKYNEVLIVDARSAYEYKVIHIKNALNIPVDDDGFVEKIEELRKKNSNKQIVMYCNGKTCMKSYKAVSVCRQHNIANVVAYDSGIFDWAKKYPSDSVLLGKSPVDPRKIIGKEELKRHMISVEEFEVQASSGKAIVLDMRDRLQREGLGIFIGVENEVQVDDTATLGKYIDKARREKKTLLIYDATGKQVEWVQYYLEEKGLKDYKFMEGGVEAYFKVLRKEFVR